jgi:histidyl-tRNA synthetase
MTTLQGLEAAIAEQSALFNQLKARADPAEAAELEAARVRLGELKKSRGALLQASGAGSKDKRKERLLLKTAKVC